MSLPAMAAIFFGGSFVFFFLLGKLTWGTGADLVDFDPIGRAETKRALDDDDLHELLELRNRRRRAEGLPELGVDEVLDDVRRDPPS